MKKDCAFYLPDGSCYINDMTGRTLCDFRDQKKCKDYEPKKEKDTMKFKDALPMEIGQDWAQRLADTLGAPVLVDIAPGVLGIFVFAALAAFFARRCRAS